MATLTGWFHSLRARVVLLLLLASVPAVVLSVIWASESRSQMVEQALEDLNRVALAATAHHGEVLFGTETLLVGLSKTLAVRSIAGRPATSGPVIASCDEPIPQVSQTFPQFRDIRVLDQLGTPICSVRAPGVAISEAERPWFVEAMEGRPFVIGQFEVSELTGRPAVIAAAPVRDERRTVQGVLIAEIGLGWLESDMSKTDLPPDSFVYLLDNEGDIITRYPKVDEARMALPPKDLATSALLSRGQAKPFVAPALDGTERAFGVANLVHSGVSLLVSVPKGVAFAEADRQYWSAISWIGIVWILTLGAAWVVTERLITRPVRSLSRAANAIRKGDLSARPAIPNSESELKELAVAFSEMAERTAQREKSLRESVKEKEFLLREIHHRVKNNLQIITSLLNIQMSDADSKPADQLLEAKTRIRALAIVHDQLYRKSDLSSIEVKRLFQDLCSQFWQIYGVDTGRVRYTVDVPHLTVDMDKAIPLALVAAEALTNVLKYAFPDQRAGAVTIAAETRDGCFMVSIKDDGVGMDQSRLRSAPNSQTLGMRLMHGLTDQLDGTLHLSADKGTEVHLSVPMDTITTRADDHDDGP